MERSAREKLLRTGLATAAVWVAATLCGLAESGDLRAGAALVDISPTTFPVPVNGSMRQYLATGIHDPMHARCLALHDGRHPLVIVEVDACMIPRDIVLAAKQIARERTGISPERIVIAATHTHSAAALTPIFQCEVDADYVATVPPRIAAGIVKAVANLEPAEWGWAFAAAPAHVFNRRWFMKPEASYENPFGGTGDRVKMNPGHAEPTVSVPSGPVDQDVAVVAVRSRGDKRPLGLVANYSLHYVGGLPAISADYFAAFADEMARRLEAADGRYAGKPPFVAMLTNGTSGNVNNVDFASPPRAKADRGLPLRAVASGVADAAERAYAAISWRSTAMIDSEARDLSLGVRKGSAAELARARTWMESIPKDRDGQWSDRNAIYARETVLLAAYPDRVPVSLQVHRIDDLSIATIPCEVFVETGLHLKKTSPFVRHFTISLANGYDGYLPRPVDHGWGGYETWRARSSYLEVEAEPKIVAALEEMAAALHARCATER